MTCLRSRRVSVAELRIESRAPVSQDIFHGKQAFPQEYLPSWGLPGVCSLLSLTETGVAEIRACRVG